MKIQAERNFNDFFTNLAFIKSAVSNAIINKDLVDDQFNTVKKYSFKWILLTLASPFYSLFGKDAYCHVRVDSVARSVLAYCELNSKYISEEMQKELSKNVLHQLDTITRNKYSSTVSNVVQKLLKMSSQATLFWKEKQSQLEVQSQLSWNLGIQWGPKEAPDVDKLAAILTVFKEVSDNRALVTITDATLQTLCEKCWEFASKIEDTATALRAYKICYDALAGTNSATLDAQYSEIITLQFVDKKTVMMPAYYKEVLSSLSPYFSIMFKGLFRETHAKVVNFPEMNKKHFCTMIEALKTGTLTLSNEIEEQLKFAQQMHEQQMSGVYDLACQIIENSIQKLTTSPDDLEFVNELRCVEYLKQSKIILNATAAYYSRYLECAKSCQTFTEKLDFLKVYGSKLTSLTLRDYSMSQISSCLKECPNLRSLNLSGCSLLHNDDLKIFESYTLLHELYLRACNNLTKEGLNHLKHLKILKTLDLSYCKWLKSADLDVLKDQTESGLKISTYGCAEDVEKWEEEKKEQKRAEEERNRRIDFSRQLAFFSQQCLICSSSFCIHKRNIMPFFM